MGPEPVLIDVEEAGGACARPLRSSPPPFSLCKDQGGPLFYGLFTLQIAVGAGIALAPGNLVLLVVNAQVLNGLSTPLILTYVLILANRRSALGDAANGRIFRGVATTCVTVVGSLSLLVLIETVTGLG